MLESYKAILRLCTVQTLKEMERRPDASGKEVKNKPMIILIDEFARLGRMEGIFNALATLASKKNFCDTSISVIGSMRGDI